MADGNYNSNNITTVNPQLKDPNDKSVDIWSTNLPTLDIREGSQWGYLPIIGDVKNGKVIHAYMYNQRYIKRDIIPVVLQTPRMFDLFPNPLDWKRAYVAFWERQCRVIEGLNASLTVETMETELGIEGAKFKEPTNVTREETNISTTVDEKYGIPHEILIDVLIRYGIMDPDLKVPLITTIPEAKGIDVYTPEWYSGTVLFIEPDVLQRKVIHAWLVSNLFPTSNPEITAKKDKKSAKEAKEMTIEWGGLALPPTNKNVMELAQKVLDSMKLWTITPDEIKLPAIDVDGTLKTDGANNIREYYNFGANDGKGQPKEESGLSAKK